MEILTTCPVCGSSDLAFYKKVKDHSISKEEFEIASCKACGFLFTNPRPAKQEISRYYESPDYISHSNSKEGLFNKTYQLIRDISINKKIKIIGDLAGTDKSLLDIGCGTGEFLNACVKNGWNAQGVEPSDKARNYAIKEYKLNVSAEDTMSSIKNESFKVITMWHVLEHVHDLKQRVNDISTLLRPGGYAVIAVPNHQSFDAGHYREFWAAYDVPRHLYHFSEKTIKTLFSNLNFEWQKSIPMKFDSFYVSMLSEKYKGGGMQMAKAVYAGMLSNTKAGSNPEMYSSVIYIFRKK